MAQAVEYLPPPANDPNGGKVVVIKYSSLVNGEDLSASIAAAYGFDGLGLLVVSGVPGVAELRKKFLPLARRIADLPEEEKNKMEDPGSFYSVGWSHGKEMMSEGKPDLAKGSFYANPLFDRPIDDEETIKKFPAFCAPNIWPKESIPELETTFKEVGKLVISVGLLLAKQCDTYAHKLCPSYPATKLYDTIKNSRTPKARLLHYFPIDENQYQDGDFSSWCGWHNDHGSLTGLVPAMYIDKDYNAVAPPRPDAGLYVKARDGTMVHAITPPDHLAFQIGEAACIHSGGYLQATPHCVRGSPSTKENPISRETFAVFMEPEWHEDMNLPDGASSDNVLRGSSTTNMPKGVPLLGTRWKPPMDFGQFSDVTFKSYY